MGETTLSHNNAPREIGTAWEVTAATYANSEGFPLERRALAGRRDLGDLMGRPGWVIGCKSEQTIRLSTYMNELRAQKDNHVRRTLDVALSAHIHPATVAVEPLIGVELVKRRNYGTGRAYAVMEYDDLLQIWRELDR